MSQKIELSKIKELRPRITVMGIGGAGCNAVNNMIATGLEGVEFVVANTDAQALAMSSAELRLQLGASLTDGLGAGARPEVGQAAAEETIEDVRAQLAGSNMVFLAAGMGGGTGTGAISVIARAAREMNILTVGIVTKPFQFEGSRRMRVAEAGIAELQSVVDTLIVIPNQNLFRIANEKTTFAEAFVLADQVLYSGIACIVDLILKEGLINLDFADVRAVMYGMGPAMMGTGEASGERRAVLAAEQAISNPLLDDVSLEGAKGLLVSIIGGKSMSLYDVDAAASRVKEEADPDANIIVGAAFDETLGDRLRVSIVASGIATAPSQQVGSFAAGGAGDIGRRPSGAGHPHLPGQSATGITEAADALYQPFRTGEPVDPHDIREDEQDEFARTLSAVVGRMEAEASDFETGSPRKGSAAAWESPDGVLIEEGLSSIPGRSGPPPIPADDTDTNDGQQGRMAEDYAAFVPGRPSATHANSRQGSTPRIPDVAEFPEVGQRAYHAHRGNDGRGAEAGTQDGRPAANEPSDELSGAAGLLRRLSRFGRREAPVAESMPGRMAKQGGQNPDERSHPNVEFAREQQRPESHGGARPANSQPRKSHKNQ